MKFGINLHLNSASQVELLPQIARMAEDYGFDQIWWADTNVNWLDPYVGLTACALSTSRIRLGTSATNPVTRHPAVTANMIMSLDTLSRGRAILGIASGDNAVKTIGKKPATIRELREAIVFIDDLITGKEAKYGDVRLRLGWANRKVPIYVAGAGEKILRMAGEVANGIITIGSSKELVDFAVGRVREGASKAGKNSQDMETCLSTACYIGATREEALENVLSVVGSMLHSSPSIVFRSSKIPATASEDIRRLNEFYDYGQHGMAGARHSQVVKDWMVDCISIAGTRDQCVEKIATIEKSGIKHIIMPILDVNVKRFLEVFGREVIPHFSPS